MIPDRTTAAAKHVSNQSPVLSTTVTTTQCDRYFLNIISSRNEVTREEIANSRDWLPVVLRKVTDNNESLQPAGSQDTAVGLTTGLTWTFGQPLSLEMPGRNPPLLYAYGKARSSPTPMRPELFNGLSRPPSYDTSSFGTGEIRRRKISSPSCLQSSESSQ